MIEKEREIKRGRWEKERNCGLYACGRSTTGNTVKDRVQGIEVFVLG